jgi:hypothetical protein
MDLGPAGAYKNLRLEFGILIVDVEAVIDRTLPMHRRQSFCWLSSRVAARPELLVKSMLAVAQQR